jgi:Protein of unknown function (DUF669)
MSTQLDQAFDVEKEEGSSFDVLPPGKYNADLMQAEVVQLKSGRGQAVSIRWCVYDGEHEGRWLFDNVIVQHDSPEAMKFGRRKFKDIATACGITAPITDVEVLVGKRAALVVGIEKDKAGEFPDKNRIRRVMAFAPGANGQSVPQDVPLNDEIPF